MPAEPNQDHQMEALSARKRLELHGRVALRWFGVWSLYAFRYLGTDRSSKTDTSGQRAGAGR